ncbi:DUF6281 family protein [Streptomyces sp. NPDC002952]|uniref:DUF6281 family protein n=1 Tax=Streptomyces sp. NPDC002952 TaxID=3364673 RepID=UPI0036839ED4
MRTVLHASRCGGVWAAVAAAVAASAVACTDVGAGGGEAASSCAFVVEYEGRTYQDVADIPFTVGDALGEAVVPACDDTPSDGDDGVPRSATTAYAVAELDPAIAVAVGDAPGDVRLVAVHRDGELPSSVGELIGGPGTSPTPSPRPR